MLQHTIYLLCKEVKLKGLKQYYSGYVDLKEIRDQIKNINYELSFIDSDGFNR